MGNVRSLDEFELRKQFNEAIKGGKYMILISRVVSEDTGIKNFQHFRVTSNFPRDEILTCIAEHAEKLQDEMQPLTEENK